MPTAEPSKSYLPWPVRIGRRVVLRHRLAHPESGGPTLTDVTGELIASDREHATVRRDGHDVRVRWDAVVAAKELPPRAARAGRPHRTIGVDDLQRLMVDGLPGLRQVVIGDWICRTAEGYTGRANSALVVGDPGASVEQAVDQAVRAYASLGQPALFQIPGETGFDPAAHPVAAEVLRRGGRLFQHTRVMTAGVRQVAVAAATPQNLAMHIAPAPNQAWWTATSDRAREHRGIVEGLIEQIRDGWYLTAVLRGGDPVASARIAYSPGWVGLYDLHTLPTHRGHGYARALVGELARHADRRAVASTYLQVSADNSGAIALYESLGYTAHNDYWYVGC